jgi:hypothetical protein
LSDLHQRPDTYAVGFCHGFKERKVSGQVELMRLHEGLAN